MARPSLCSLMLPLQQRFGSGARVPPYLPASQPASTLVPGLACGRQFVCGSYDA